MITIQREKLVDFGVRLLKAKGVPDASARYIADFVVQTEAFGVKTHGVTFFTYADQQIPGELNPTAEPILVREKGATALIDGNNGFSQLAMRMAESIAVKKAKKHGMAMIAVRNCFWLGALGPYLISPARQGFFAQLLAQTSTCKDCAPFGGIDPRFSTNPIAMAFPTGSDPMLSDFSTTMMAMGKVNQMIRNGEKTPEPAFMTKDGVLSNDPRVVQDGGTILFLGGAYYGYRGYSLSLWTEALTAIAGGDSNNPQAKTRQCFTFTVIDPDAFAGNEYYLREIGRFLAFMRTSRPVPSSPGIRLPGEREFSLLRESATQGIPLEPFIVDKLNEVAVKNGIERLT
jgi:L-lactate dehydrogenase